MPDLCKHGELCGSFHSALHSCERTAPLETLTAETRTLGQVLESVRALLEARTVQCGHYNLDTGEPYYEKAAPPGEYRCYYCVDTDGRILDPAYAPLLALVRDSDPQGPGDTCADYWEAAPDGALEGALRKELLKDIWRRLPATQGLAELLETISNLMEEPGDTRIPALEAFEKWLKGEA